jgi:hypothetical protein
MTFDEGTYRGCIKNYGVMRSQVGKLFPTAFIEFDVIGQYDPSTGQIVPRPPATRSYRKAITPKTVGWLAADLKAIGYDRPDLASFDPEAPGAVDLFGREIDVDCEHEVYQGQTRERWSIHREINREKLRRDDLASLDAQFGDTFRRVFGAQTPTVAPAVTEANADEPL